MQRINRRKIVTVGDGSIGKMCFLVRFYKDTFAHGTPHTAVENFHVRDVIVNGNHYEVAYWDAREYFWGPFAVLYKGCGL